MASKQEKVFTHQFTPESKEYKTVGDELTEKLERLGYPTFALRKYEGEEVIVLYIKERLICGASYALSHTRRAV
jgi:hypothetical protein